jgi:hypothetical protein
LNVRINVSPFRFVLCAIALSVWSVPAFSQRIEFGSEEKTVHSGAAESNATEHSDVKTHHDSSVTDWTHDHMLYPRIGPMDRLIALQKDPRAIQHWQESYRKDYVRWRGHEGHRGEHRNRSYMHPDWNILLGGSMDNATYASKWTFDSNESLTGAGPDAGACATDYLVVPIDPTSAGGAGVSQPNIIGLNNLYSGTAPGPTGVCNRPGPPAGDDGVSATQYFSYTVIGDDGIVATSPATSMDGNFIAFVEVGTVAGARFHVLAWAAGDGNTAGNRQDALTSSIQIPGTVPFATAQLVAGSGTATDLALGAATDSFSSPYVEYSDDVAYVGDDAGNIYKIKNVFCPAWAPCGGALPSLDGSFGTGGVMNVGAVCQLSGITVDGSGGNIYAGCSDGNLYAFTSTGTPVTGSPLAVGEGTGVQADGGIIDAPMLDVVNRWVYVETGDCTNTALAACTVGNPILVQASMSNLGTNSVATLGPGGNFFNIHHPAFNDAYFSSGTAANWLLYEFASDNAGPTPPGGGASPEIVLYGITFGPLHAMVGGPPANAFGFTGPGALEVSPLTEFLTTGGEDRIFASNLGPGPGNVVAFNITAGFPSTGTVESFNTQGTGTSGIIADNTDSAAGQANSIYFGPLGAVGTNPNTVVKLTQGNVSF